MPRCSSKDGWQPKPLPSKICSWEPNSVGDLLLSSISRKSLTLIFHSAHTHYKSIGRSEKLILQETLSEPFQFAVYIFAHNIDQNMRSLAGTQSKSLWALVKSSNLSGYLISWQINYEVWAPAERPNGFKNRPIFILKGKEKFIKTQNLLEIHLFVKNWRTKMVVDFHHHFIMKSELIADLLSP